jgi:cytochrome c oxidase subunit 2
MNDLLRSLLYLPPQASTFAVDIDVLHFFVITTTMLGAIFVFIVAVYFLLRYRRRTPHALTTRLTLAAPTEVFIIVSLQGLFLLFWAIGAWQYNHLMTPPADALVVYVTGKQWMWKFSYPDGRATMDVLMVPVGRPVKLVMTSRDVIHSFYVPAFRMKHDVLPGRYYTTWFNAKWPGVFDIECAEYCGVGHSRMLGQVRVMSDDEYRRWLEGAPIAGDLAERGRDVASQRACFNCHTVDGQPHIGPTFAGLYGSSVLLSDGRTVVADEAYLTRSMMDPDVEIVASYKPVMPTFHGVLQEPEVAALVEFIKSIRGRPPAPQIALPKVVVQTPEPQP